MKQFTPYIIAGILLFHILTTGYAFYSLYFPFYGWTLEHVYPIGLLLFSVCWFFIWKKIRVAAIVYFMLVFTEIIIKLFTGSTAFGKVLGSILYPIDLIFAFVLLLLYKVHFGDRSAS